MNFCYSFPFSFCVSLSWVIFIFIFVFCWFCELQNINSNRSSSILFCENKNSPFLLSVTRNKVPSFPSIFTVPLFYFTLSFHFLNLSDRIFFLIFLGDDKLKGESVFLVSVRWVPVFLLCTKTQILPWSFSLVWGLRMIRL